MSDLDYLKGAWDEFRKFEEKEHAEIKEQLTAIHAEINSLKTWRAVTTGIGAAFGAAVGFLITLFR